jgi:hypothetical protein
MTPGTPEASRFSIWRVIAAAGILCGLVFLAVQLLPVYFENLQFQRYVEATTHRLESQTQSDDSLRAAVVEKAASMGLPVLASNVLIRRSNDNLRIDVRYVVRVNLPLYTVDLHFYPGAGSH